MIKIQASVSKGWLNKHGGFVFSPDRDSDVSDSPIRNLKDISELPSIEKVLKLPLIQSLEKQYLKACKEYSDCTIIPPFFWDVSGRANIHGIITTSYKFLGQDIFTDMMLEA